MSEKNNDNKELKSLIDTFIKSKNKNDSLKKILKGKLIFF